MFGLSCEKESDSYQNALSFLENHALSDDDYLHECIPIMQNIFKPIDAGEFDIFTSSLNMLFQQGYNMSLHISSPMFSEETYHFIQDICLACGDRYFYIIEDGDDTTTFHLRMPVTTNWEQLLSGGFISAVLFSMPYNKYRVFGDSGSWGKWCDYENAWSDYEIFGSRLDLPEIREYNKLMALSVEDYLYLKNEVGFPQSIRILT